MRTIVHRTRSFDQQTQLNSELDLALIYSRSRHYACVESIMSRSGADGFESITVSAANPTFHLPQTCQESISILQTKECAYMPL